MMTVVINQLAWWRMTPPKLCVAKIAGKNTSNFAAHIKRFHKQTHETCVKKERENVSGKSRAVKRDILGSVKLQTLKECLNRRIVSWPKESEEHRLRVQSIMKMVIGTSCPISLLDQPSVRDMITVIDHKSKMPGVFVCFSIKHYTEIVKVCTT